MGEALLEAGFTRMEVTLRMPLALEAGALFLVSPGLVGWTEAQGSPIFLGWPPPLGGEQRWGEWFVLIFTIEQAREINLPNLQLEDKEDLEAQNPLPVRPVEKTLLAELDLASPWGLAAWDPQTLLTTQGGKALKLALSAPLW